MAWHFFLCYYAPDTPILVEHKLLGLVPLDAYDKGLDPVEANAAHPIE